MVALYLMGAGLARRSRRSRHFVPGYHMPPLQGWSRAVSIQLFARNLRPRFEVKLLPRPCCHQLSFTHSAQVLAQNIQHAA
jgi:hypothetical protein